jgi:adenylylsulfate kinase-like enzyme
MTITAAISPYRDTRAAVRRQIGAFVEVYVRCSLDELVRRDVKGLYARALRGEIANFTGVSDPYEEPLAPELTVDTEHEDVETSIGRLLTHLEQAGYLAPDAGPNGANAPAGHPHRVAVVTAEGGRA